MIDKRALSGLLAMAALSLASSGGQFSKRHASEEFDSKKRKHRDSFDSEEARQTRLACSELTKEQRIWNDAVDAKKAAKKATI